MLSDARKIPQACSNMFEQAWDSFLLTWFEAEDSLTLRILVTIKMPWEGDHCVVVILGRGKVKGQDNEITS